TPRQILTTLEIPGALPSIFGGLRVGVTLAAAGAVVGEWAGASKGLAVLINLARGSLFDIPLMFATLLTIALVGIALYLAVVVAERRLVRDRCTRPPKRRSTCRHPSPAARRGSQPSQRSRSSLPSSRAAPAARPGGRPSRPRTRRRPP